jgi:hypothetical protein
MSVSEDAPLSKRKPGRPKGAVTKNRQKSFVDALAVGMTVGEAGAVAGYSRVWTNRYGTVTAEQLEGEIDRRRVELTASRIGLAEMAMEFEEKLMGRAIAEIEQPVGSKIERAVLDTANKVVERLDRSMGITEGVDGKNVVNILVQVGEELGRRLDWSEDVVDVTPRGEEEE